jgi:hypothetical protein
MKNIAQFENFANESDLKESGIYGDGPTPVEVAAKKLFPNLEIRGDSIFMNNKLLFNSTSPQCVESFLFGMMIGKTQKD